MTAAEASRAFEALLDAVETGETIIVTRDGKRVARIEQVSAGNGAEVTALLSSIKVDPDFAADVRAARQLPAPEGAGLRLWSRLAVRYRTASYKPPLGGLVDR